MVWHAGHDGLLAWSANRLTHTARTFQYQLTRDDPARLTECAAGIGLSSRAVRLELEDLRSLSLPCILHWNMNHFVVLHKVRGSRLVIHDPEKGKVTLSLQDAGKHFTGVALELMPASDLPLGMKGKNPSAPTDR